MRMTAVKAASRTVDQKISKAIEDDGKARGEIAPGRPIFTEISYFSDFTLSG